MKISEETPKLRFRITVSTVEERGKATKASSFMVYEGSHEYLFDLIRETVLKAEPPKEQGAQCVTDSLSNLPSDIPSPTPRPAV